MFIQSIRAVHPREYRIWKLMRARCSNSRLKTWHRYGGRGIRVCPEWDDFAAFLAAVGPAPTTKHTIDRIDNDGPYSPWNCRWATRREQSRNTSTNRLVTWEGRTLCIAAWSEALGVARDTLNRRLKRMPLEAAMVPGRKGRGNVVTFRGERRRLADLARERGINLKTVHSRLTLLGWTLEEALSCGRYGQAQDAEAATRAALGAG